MKVTQTDYNEINYDIKLEYSDIFIHKIFSLDILLATAFHSSFIYLRQSFLQHTYF